MKVIAQTPDGQWISRTFRNKINIRHCLMVKGPKGWDVLGWYTTYHHALAFARIAIASEEYDDVEIQPAAIIKRGEPKSFIGGTKS